MAFCGSYLFDLLSDSSFRNATLSHSITQEGSCDLSGGMFPGIESHVVSTKKSRLLCVVLDLLRLFRRGRGHGAPRAFPASRSLLASCCWGWWGYVLLSASPLCPVRQTWHCFLLLTLCSWLFVGPADLKTLDLLLIDFLVRLLFSPWVTFCSCSSFLGRMWDLGKACPFTELF